MAGLLRLAAVLVTGLVVSGCTPCGGWSKFNAFPASGACHSGEAR